MRSHGIILHMEIAWVDLMKAILFSFIFLTAVRASMEFFTIDPEVNILIDCVDDIPEVDNFAVDIEQLEKESARLYSLRDFIRRQDNLCPCKRKKQDHNIQLRKIRMGAEWEGLEDRAKKQKHYEIRGGTNPLSYSEVISDSLSKADLSVSLEPLLSLMEIDSDSRVAGL